MKNLATALVAAYLCLVCGAAHADDADAIAGIKKKYERAYEKLGYRMHWDTCGANPDDVKSVGWDLNELDQAVNAEMKSYPWESQAPVYKYLRYIYGKSMNFGACQDVVDAMRANQSQAKTQHLNDLLR